MIYVNGWIEKHVSCCEHRRVRVVTTDRCERCFGSIGLIGDGLIEMAHAEKIVAKWRRETTEERRSKDETVLIGQMIERYVEIIRYSYVKYRVIRA
jgi:hypothetical protein